VIEAHFGESSPYSLGVEEELMILDAETLAPAAGVSVIVREAEKLDLPGTLKTELHASIVELNTNVCADVAEATAALRELRAAAARIAGENGLAIAAAGAHPTAVLESLPVVQEERYLDMIETIGRAARRQGVSGLHVHVGVESADRCYERLESVLPWLPVVLALSVNSPFVDGATTGMLSNRVGILAELPRAGAPPAFGGYAEWETWIEHLVALGVIEDHTRVWWDIRPNPRFGTLEIRIADQPTSLARTELLVRMLRDLVEHAPAQRTPRGDYAQNRVAAASRGLDAELVHPQGDRVVSARELARELIGSEPPEPEALFQLAAGDSVAADLVARTLT
jgi:glutamate---cysteine ligase / carboxylate-amine ligase